MKDIGWVEAGKLKEGDKLFSKELGDTEIAAVREDMYLDRDVYNLQLEGNHNFFVSELGLLVHNDTACAELLKKLDDQIAKLVKEGGDIQTIEALRKQREKIVGGILKNTKKISSGKNFKDHFLRHKKLLEKITGKKYSKFKEHGQEFLDDIGKLINDETVKYAGQGTLNATNIRYNIYRGEGITIVTKSDGEWVTILESGKGIDKNIKFIQ